jgi:GntR family trehalose operon transcriptional repressor
MRPAYDSIYFDLKDTIDNGLYGYKDYLPSESVLVKRYGCAHNTVRKALEVLARDGYVQPIHGKGVRVIYRTHKPETTAERTYELKDIESFRQSVTRQGFEATTKVLSMETMVADEEFANLTGFDKDERIVHLERVRYVNGKPLMRETNYFRADIVEGMTKEDAEYSIYHFIEDVRGEKLVTSRRRVTVEHVNDRDVELLELDGADYLAVVLCETFDGAGLLCEATVVRHVPQMFVLEQTAIRTIVSQRMDA